MGRWIGSAGPGRWNAALIFAPVGALVPAALKDAGP